MEISLDSVLFWSGLGLLLVGLFVFLIRQEHSTRKEKEQQPLRRTLASRSMSTTLRWC